MSKKQTSCKPNSVKNNELSLEDLNYELPEELIAQTPLSVRHQSRLLSVDRKRQELSHKSFEDLTDILKPDDLIVVNNTRVIPTRLLAKRKSGAEIRVQLIKPVITASKNYVWEAMAMPIRRLNVGETLEIISTREGAIEAKIDRIILDKDGFKRIVINFGDTEKLQTVLRESGHAPLPPYIKRDLDPQDQVLKEERLEDLNRYQTVFAQAPGAVAAPTAGLHFSDELIERLKEKGVGWAEVTLHVGAGTFKPITTSIEEHSIEEEIYSISDQTAELINKTRSRGGRVIACGTTTLRALESAGITGRILSAHEKATTLYVKPGFQFKIVDCLITNFHLPGSSLLVLVATFAGSKLIINAYKEAVEREYRFYSYGDAMLIT